METVIIKRAVNTIFGDSEFKKHEYEKFATSMLYLAIAMQSWLVSKKSVLAQYHISYSEKLMLHKWMEDKGQYYELTPIFQKVAKEKVKDAIRNGYFIEESADTLEQVFEVGSYRIQIKKAREIMKDYLQKEVILNSSKLGDGSTL